MGEAGGVRGWGKGELPPRAILPHGFNSLLVGDRMFQPFDFFQQDFNENYYSFALILLVNIVVCS